MKQSTADLKDKIKKAQRKKDKINNEWYSLRSAIGNDWAMFYFLLGGREAGKSYAVTNFFVRQFIKYGRPFYWLRLTEESAAKLLNNGAAKLVDPDLRRKYNLDLSTNGDIVYQVLERDDKGKILKKKMMARVMALSTFYNDKGSGLFDKDFLNDPNMYYNICLDEMNREKSEKNSFDIVYAFTNQLENLIRSTKKKVRIICIGNTLEEASDILCAFNFIPEEFGRFKLKSKRAIIDYMQPTEAYLARRKGTVADILMPNASTFTNKVITDNSLVYTKRVIRPTAIIKFSKDKDDWFTIWDSNVIAKYNGENVKVIPMRPYMDEVFNSILRNNIYEIFDNRGYRFRNLVTFKFFQKNLELLRPKK